MKRISGIITLIIILIMLTVENLIYSNNNNTNEYNRNNPSVITNEIIQLQMKTHHNMMNTNKYNNAPKISTKDEIVITATKTETPRSDLGTSVTVITADEMEKRGKGTVQDTLSDVPGLTISQNSTFGGQSSIFFRGLNNSGHVLVLVDGIKMNDPMEPSKSFNFAHLTTDNIERIEVVRGPQNTLYGADAISGIINIITKKGKGKFNVELFTEAGSFKSFREHIGINGASEKIDYSFLISRFDTKGISKAKQTNKNIAGYEKDGYDNTSVSSKIGYNPVPELWLNLYFNYITADFDIDESAFEDDPNKTDTSRQFCGGFEIKHLLHSWWDYKLTYSYMELYRTDKDNNDLITLKDYMNSWYRGNIDKTEWQNNFHIAKIDTITVGFDYEIERGSSYLEGETTFGPYKSEFKQREIDDTGYYIQNHLILFDNFSTVIGLRGDDHSITGTDYNYKISASYKIRQSGTRIKGNYGTGFKAPSLFQFYAPIYGNTNLRPESSKNYDIGIEQNLLGDKIMLDIVYFHSDFKDQIQWSSIKNEYTNIKLQTSGIELGINIKPINILSADISYTYTKAINMESRSNLTRIPRDKVSLNINYNILKSANINLGLNYTGKREEDDKSYPPGRIILKEYTIINLAVLYRATDNFRISARIENLLNEDYMAVYGYAMPGRAYYAGIKVNF